ncbi:C-X-C motif chemokine 9-like [Pelobates fuscus]|uniref:C-X-C motif chemokine 9-like n=1 Tax=Pelobates fuscus TaxID=191477 RepID=UPI002FE4D051
MDHLSLLLCSLFIPTSLQSIQGSIDRHIENVQIIPLKVQEFGLSLVPTRCRCIKFIQQIHPKHIGDFEVTAPDSSCQFPEVIVRLKKDSSEKCLDHKTRQGKKLIRCWNKFQDRTQKRMKCMRRKKKNSKVQKKKTIS